MTLTEDQKKKKWTVMRENIMNCETEFLGAEQYAIEYRGKHIGVTQERPLLTMMPELYEAGEGIIDGKTASKIITNMSVAVFVAMKEIDSAFADFSDGSGEITEVVFGEGVLDTGGELDLLPISAEDDVSFCFPKAVLMPEAVYPYKNTKEYCLKMHFEVFEDPEGILMQKVRNKTKADATPP